MNLLSTATATARRSQHRLCRLTAATSSLRAAVTPSTSTFHVPAAHEYVAKRSHYSYSSPGQYDASSSALLEQVWQNRDFAQRGFTVGIGGPVGSGKTALTLKLLQIWRALPDDLQLGVVTNDIFTQEDAEFLTRHEALPPDRIAAVETGGCPHAAIREDVSSNLSALEQLTASSAAAHNKKHNSSAAGNAANTNMRVPLLLCESGGDNLAANFSRELADITLYVIDVAGGDKIPRKGGPGITQSDLLIINKIDLAKAVGSDLGVMERDANRMRRSNHLQDDEDDDSNVGPTVFCSVRDNVNVPEISDFVLNMYEQATGVALQRQQQQKASSHSHAH